MNASMIFVTSAKAVAQKYQFSDEELNECLIELLLPEERSQE